MPVIAVVNRKGGSGKSTLATNIAAWCAHNGWQVMQGDVDRQRSMHSWLSRRPAAVPEVTSWAVDRSRVLRPPAGTTHVVLDTPGALYDHDLAKLVINVDALVVPIGPSLFDRDASLQFLAELRQLPRVSSGRCRLVAVGMRWPAEKRAAWLGSGRQWDAPLLTVIPELAVYRTSLETGGGIFDLPEEAIETETEPWRPLLSCCGWCGRKATRRASRPTGSTRRRTRSSWRWRALARSRGCARRPLFRPHRRLLPPRHGPLWQPPNPTAPQRRCKGRPPRRPLRRLP